MAENKMSMVEVRFWLKEAESAEKRQKEELINRNNYPLLVKYYEGKQVEDSQSDGVTSSEISTALNEFFPNTNSLISEIMYQAPDIMVEAKKPEAEEGVDVMKSALQYAFDETNSLEECRIALFDMIYAGYSAVEVGYLIEKDNYAKEFEKPKDNSLLGKVKRALGSVDEAEEKFEKESEVLEASYASSEKTYVRRYNPLNVLFDWKAERLRDSRYIIKKIYMTKAEFDVKYPNFKDKVIAGAEMEYSCHDDKNEKKTVLLYEFQIKKKNGEYWNLCVSPQYTFEAIDYYKRPYVHDGFNMKIGTLHKYGKIYPVSIAQVNKKLQDDMNNYITHLMEVAERNIPKIGVNVQNVKEDGIKALRSANVNDIVPVNGTPNANIMPIQATNASTENKELLAMFQNQNDKLWAVSESRQQGSSQAKFATELQIQEAGFQAKQSDIQEGLRDLLVQIIEGLKDLVINFWDNEYFFKVTSGQKPVWYIGVKDELSGTIINPTTRQPASLTDVLMGDYYIKIDISTALRPNKEKNKADLVEFATWVTSPNVMQLLMMNNLQVNPDIIKNIAKQFGVNPETALIESTPPPAPEAPPVEPKELGEIETIESEESGDEMGNKRKVERKQRQKIYEQAPMPQGMPGEMPQEGQNAPVSI